MSIQQSKMFDERKYTSMERMRRSELRKLAKDYGLDVDLRGKKDDMLPILEQANKRGIFEKPPPVIEPPKPTEYTVEHMGVKFGWCVLDGDKIVKRGLQTKDEALEYIG